MAFGTASRVIATRLVPKQNAITSMRNITMGRKPPSKLGGSLPVDINRRVRFSFVYALYWFTGIGFPFFAVHHNMKK